MRKPYAHFVGAQGFQQSIGGFALHPCGMLDETNANKEIPILDNSFPIIYSKPP